MPNETGETIGQKSTVPTMAELIDNLLERIAQAIEDELNVLETIKTIGGPYETSNRLGMEKKLKSAAAAALQVIVSDPSFHQPQM